MFFAEGACLLWIEQAVIRTQLLLPFLPMWHGKSLSPPESVLPAFSLAQEELPLARAPGS